jgi:hypothetical protein
MWAFLYQHSVITFSSRYFCQSHFSRPPLFLSVSSSSLSLRLASALVPSFKLNEVLRRNAMGCSSCVWARESAEWARTHSIAALKPFYTRVLILAPFNPMIPFQYLISRNDLLHLRRRSLSSTLSVPRSFAALIVGWRHLANCKFSRAHHLPRLPIEFADWKHNQNVSHQELPMNSKFTTSILLWPFRVAA